MRLAMAFSAMPVLALLASPTSADEPSATELRREGKKHLEAGDHAAACPKLARSHELDPDNGTLRLVANCHEAWDKPVKARAAWRELAKRARSAGDDALAGEAEQHADALATRVGRVRIVVPIATPGLEVLIADEVLPPPRWGQEVEIVAGGLTVSARSQGRRPWSQTVAVKAGATAAVVVTIPRLSPTGAIERTLPSPKPLSTVEPAPALSLAPLPEASVSTTLVAGGVFVGLGVAALGVFTAFAVLAADTSGEADEYCDEGSEGSICTQEGIAIREEARIYAAVATATLAFSVPLLVVGPYLLITEGNTLDAQTKTAWTLTARPLPGGGTLTLGRRF